MTEPLRAGLVVRRRQQRPFPPRGIRVDEALVEQEVVGKVAWVYLNRPHAMNALSDRLLDQLDQALEDLAHDTSVRVVVITGRGKAFSAGGDLKSVGRINGDSFNPAQLVAQVRRAAATFDRIRDLDKPVIAAVNGYAIAGGMSLILACDLVIAGESARIGEGHAQYGMVSGSGSVIRLARVVGPVVAKYLAFRGKPVSAAELLPFGLINEVVPDNDLHHRVSALAEELTSRSPRVLASFKRLIDDGLEQPIALAARTASQSLAVHVHSNTDMQEGLAAFQDKREPKFED